MGFSLGNNNINTTTMFLQAFNNPIAQGLWEMIVPFIVFGVIALFILLLSIIFGGNGDRGNF